MWGKVKGARAPADTGHPTLPDANGSRSTFYKLLYNRRVWVVLLFLDNLLGNMARMHLEESAKMQSELLLQISIVWIRAASCGKKCRARSAQSNLYSGNSLEQLVKVLLISFMVYISTQLSREGFPKMRAGVSASPDVPVTHSLSFLWPTQARTTNPLHSTAAPVLLTFAVFIFSVFYGHLWPVSLSLRDTLPLNSKLPFPGSLDC